MNYDDALQLEDKEGNQLGVWHMTTKNRRMNSGKPRPLGDCGNHGKDDQGKLIGHPDADSAFECYRQYLIRQDWLEIAVPESTTEHRRPRIEHPCAVEHCEHYTTKGLALRWAWQEYWLCDEDRTKDGLQRVVRSGYSIHS